jgi:hypothetical protein
MTPSEAAPAAGTTRQITLNGQSFVVLADRPDTVNNIADNLTAFVARHAAPLHLSMHPRAYFESALRRGSFWAAKRETWRATRRILQTLSGVGRVTHADTGQPFTLLSLMRYILLRKRAKNFTIVVQPDGQGHAR